MFCQILFSGFLTNMDCVAADRQKDRGRFLGLPLSSANHEREFYSG